MKSSESLDCFVSVRDMRPMRLSPRQSMKLLKSRMAGSVIGALMMMMGMGGFAHVAKITIDAKSAKDWMPHQAQVERAALVAHENDKGGKSYTVDVSYLFEWEGAMFKGTRYRLHDKSTPIAQENNDIVEALLRSKAEGRSYPIFVNPKNPQQSAVINTVHPKARQSSLFLGFLFSILGYFTGFNPKLFKKKPDA